MPSPANALEFCQGTIAEMPEVDVYETIERFAAAGKIGYVHFRNVRGHVPDYTEVFIDEGDVDMVEALGATFVAGTTASSFRTIAPDELRGSWHAGMAYALGYIRAALRVIEAPRSPLIG